MKKLILILLPAMILSIYACEKARERPEEKGSVEFLINTGQGILKSTPSDSIPPSAFRILIAVSDRNGVTIIPDTSVAVYSFGDGLVSEKLRMNAGSFLLTKFMLIDNNGKVLYAAPLERSPRAYLVNKPLPLRFDVKAGASTTLIPEVLPVNGSNPSEFGYVSFGMKVVNPLPVYVIVVLDDPRYFGPVNFVPANLVVSARDGWLHTFHLESTVNKIIIKGGVEEYRFEVMKDGYSPAKYHFSENELRMTSETEPLILRIGGAPMESVIIKPGPDKGKDALISDLEPTTNFGSSAYFEASFISEPVLTVMRTNRSLIWFDMNAVPKSAKIEKVMLTLYMKKPLSWDTLYENTAWYVAVFQQVIEPWDEYGVTWDNQPATTETNQVYVSPQPQLSSNARTYDITSLYNPMLESPLPMAGILFKLYPSPQFPGFRFASSDDHLPAMRPELKVYYSYLPD
ncbi:MAG TPA: DNRLRE domain-containing protein [Bacteroidales bacterium]|nr:DNRLRE domain-containing protein [Bacteroidales bacterium]